jgi:hypothetical protein
MSQPFSSSNPLNVRSGHPKFHGDVAVTSNKRSGNNASHVGVAQFGFWSWFSAFGNHILRIIFESTEEEMVDSDARRVVALVADKHTMGNGSVMKLPRRSVRHSASIGSSSSCSNLAVSPMGKRTIPNPASIFKLRHMFEKMIVRPYRPSKPAFARAELSASFSKLGCVRPELFSACLAISELARHLFVHLDIVSHPFLTCQVS